MLILMLPFHFDVIWYWTIKSSFLNVAGGNIEITKLFLKNLKLSAHLSLKIRIYDENHFWH